VGISEDQGDFDVKIFHQRVTNLLKEKGIHQKKACIDANLGRGAITTWKNGSIPSVDKVFRLAKYLNRSVPWLLIGVDETGLSDSERNLLEAYNQLNDTGKEAAISAVRGLIVSFPLSSEQAGALSEMGS